MPFYGVEKMTAWLIREGYNVNVKRIRRLMRKMGLEAIYPKRRLKHALHREQEVPILIKGSSGRISQSGMGSRHNLYTNDNGTFCLETLDDALAASRPVIFNTDQGSQFTSKEFTDRLEDSGIMTKYGW
jgi:putative transposase